MEQKSILFYDSGIGGVSVLAVARQGLPSESFIYFADTKNAPYGDKTVEQIRSFVLENVAELLESHPIKAIVIACNTATSAAIAELRAQYPNLVVVGMEPALKPAVEASQDGNVMVLATEVTLREAKFLQLCERYSEHANIIPLPCPGLMNFAEEGTFDGAELAEYLRDKFADGAKKCNGDLSAVVLGCTHYSFLASAIEREIAGYSHSEVQIFDGREGTVRELEKQLDNRKWLSQCDGNAIFLNSLNDEAKNAFAEQLSEMPMGVKNETS